jgi:hypothetical protein
MVSIDKLIEHKKLENMSFNFCYLIRVEHEKWSEMCVWIVRFGQKLRYWDR